MGYPTVASITTSEFNTQATSFAVPMPATTASGDLLFMFGGHAGDNHLWNAVTGWTNMWNAASGTHVGGGWYKIADGTEGGTTVTVSRDNAIGSRATFQVWRITGRTYSSSDIEHGTEDTTITNSPNPPSISPSWGTAYGSLLIATFTATDKDLVVTAWPTNYNDNQTTIGTTTSSTSTSEYSASASQNAVVSSDDPSAFDRTGTNTRATVAQTVAVKGTLTATPSAPPFQDHKLYIWPRRF